ncbi:MAG TPA: DmsC/YnfH family molybdoenzyme membrane anchor subunit [Candidatus Solibacter sp.]|nr:DmsC/YnfH family molybdoenzyme membrane anchor subunit [Candidatus Solibacter sp.]
MCRIGTALPPANIPDRKPAPGEQYRFHFDMTRCIGCRCCEVACAEQNGNPYEINWRRVGEIEGGSYPHTQRLYLSMGCNHCVEPSCLTGCPVDAYQKNSVTGLVLHSAQTCIGCQYCTWNCPYGVPQYNGERGVVGKCDLCANRLDEGRAPACVDACPEQAIGVELVNIAEWRGDFAAANAPGMPPAEITISTTRITLPEASPASLERADHHRMRKEDPHWPLVAMLTLTQLAAGAFLYLAILGTRKGADLAALAVAGLALAASTLHLGRPVHAWRAMKMWRRSWLSREVLLFTLFAGAAMVPGLAPMAAALGIAGVTASAMIYLVPARPAWNSKRTVLDFCLTVLLLGPLFLAALGMPVPRAAVIAAGAAQLLNQIARVVALSVSEEFELRASARLLTGELRGWLVVRLVLLAACMFAPGWFGLAMGLTGELVSRYLFFVSVVPKSVAGGFVARRAA